MKCHAHSLQWTTGILFSRIEEMKFFRTVLGAQLLYYMATALWPLLHLESFMFITGYKQDLWLVKTVGALLIPVSVTMLFHLIVATDHRSVVILAASCTVAFMSIDCYYALSGIISDVYLLDAGVQLLFLLGWMIVVIRKNYQRD